MVSCSCAGVRGCTVVVCGCTVVLLLHDGTVVLGVVYTVVGVRLCRYTVCTVVLMVSRGCAGVLGCTVVVCGCTVVLLLHDGAIVLGVVCTVVGVRLCRYGSPGVVGEVFG